MLIVNANLANDRTIPVDELRAGSVVRTAPAISTLGGKGVNVARICRAFAQPAVVVGFLPERSAADLAALAASEGAELDGVPVAGTVRQASILLERSGRVTVLNEPGVTVTDPDWDRLTARIEDRLAGHTSIACSGSVPPGSAADSYGRIIDLARRAAVRCLVDASGPALAGAVAAGADIVSPNLAEAEAVLLGSSGEPVDPSGDDVVTRSADAVAGLVRLGARAAVVSAGSHGAAFSIGTEMAWCPAPRVTVRNPIGAGDSFVAGLLLALEAGRSWPDAVRRGIVIASASCEDQRAGGIDIGRVDPLLADLGPTVMLTGTASASPATGGV